VPWMTKQSLHPNQMLTEQWAILCRRPSGPEVAQQSVTPGFARWERKTASRREAAVQGADGPDLLRFTGTFTCGCGEAAVVLAVASVSSDEPEILRCISGVGGHSPPTRLQGIREHDFVAACSGPCGRGGLRVPQKKMANNHLS
jgi:hypothetical protein